MGPEHPRREEAGRVDQGSQGRLPRVSRTGVGPPEPERIQQTLSDRVPGTGRDGNRELGRAGHQAMPPNRRRLGREDLDTAGLPPGTGGV